ncbi:30S ribosomal protein S17 [Candidatus Shapirobacteria bacterium]|nr:30S ribosomal protein S17 [Candidatus Shapirobacteria bacterium]
MKNLKGRVVSAKALKTVLVEVIRRAPDPFYKKLITRKKKYAAHDEIGVELGNLVELKEVRPISKTKRWQVVKVIKK